MYSWCNWPLKDEPLWKSFLLAFFISGMGVVVGISFDNATTAVVSVLLLVLSTGNYWIPTHYQIDENGIIIKRLCFEKKRPWRCFKRVASDSAGIFLGISGRPSPLDSFRGESISCPGKANEIHEFAKRHIN